MLVFMQQLTKFVDSGRFNLLFTVCKRYNMSQTIDFPGVYNTNRYEITFRYMCIELHAYISRRAKVSLLMSYLRVYPTVRLVPSAGAATAVTVG